MHDAAPAEHVMCEVHVPRFIMGFQAPALLLLISLLRRNNACRDFVDTAWSTERTDVRQGRIETWWNLGR